MTHGNPPGTSSAHQKRICARCHGFMVANLSDNFPAEAARRSSALTWRCVNCGEQVDEQIAANRSTGCSNKADRIRLLSVSERRWRG